MNVGEMVFVMRVVILRHGGLFSVYVNHPQKINKKKYKNIVENAILDCGFYNFFLQWQLKDKRILILFLVW